MPLPLLQLSLQFHSRVREELLISQGPYLLSFYSFTDTIQALWLTASSVTVPP
jgi:hypothetical protein